MHTDTDKKKPTGGGNPTAGDTDRGILAAAVQRIKLALLALAVIFGGLR